MLTGWLALVVDLCNKITDGDFAIDRGLRVVTLISYQHLEPQNGCFFIIFLVQVEADWDTLSLKSLNQGRDDKCGQVQRCRVYFCFQITHFYYIKCKSFFNLKII